MLTFETAKELAENAAHHEGIAFKGAFSIPLPPEFAREYPWGWIFESAVDSTDHAVGTYPGIVVSVDRFSGKTQIIAGASIANDDPPLMELLLAKIGASKASVISLYRELTGKSASDTMELLRSLPALLAVGDPISLRSINQAFIGRGAETILQRRKT